MMRPAGPVYAHVPEGDNRARMVCRDCGFINYVNPKIVVGAVCLWGDLILMCRRAIEPRKGYWTIPAGYLEVHESTEQGAHREAFEEAGARIKIEGLLAVYALTHLSQVQLIYRARLADPNINPGPESIEACLLRWDDIPWDDIAFASVRWALDRHREVQNQATFLPATNPPGARGGASA